MHLAGIRVSAGFIESPNTLQRLFLARTSDLMLQLIRDIEVVFDGTLTAAGDKSDVGQPCLGRLFHSVLHQRLVDDGQHFFRHGFGGGQKTRPVTGHRK